MKESERIFLEKLILVNPITGEHMDITKTEGAEKGLDHVCITTEGISGAFIHKIYTEEI